MPKVIDGKPIDEEKWNKAKEIAANQGHSDDYDYITGIYQKMMGTKSYEFFTDNVMYSEVETKSGKKYYITGFISTSDIDVYNDLVTEQGLSSMITQLKGRTVKLDIEHAVYKDMATGNSEFPNPVLPPAKIIDAAFKTTESGSKGIWVKAEMNTAHPYFNNIWASIKSKFLEYFSIAYIPVRAVVKSINNVKVRLLDDLKLLNVAITGDPVNRNCKFDQVMVKSLLDMEENTMTEENVEQKGAPVEEEKKEVKEEEQEEEKKEEKEDSEEEESKEEEDANAEVKSILNEIKAELKSVLKENAELKSKVEKLENQPVLKSRHEEQVLQENKPVLKGMLEAIR